MPLQHRSPQQVSRLEALAKTLDDDLAAHPSQPSRRKRKKRRKRRLPRSSVPRGGRARRRQRQRRVFGSPGFDVPRAVFPSLVVRPRILGILAGMDQKDICKVWDIPVMRGETCTHSANCAEDRRSCRCCSWTVPPPGIGGIGFGLSPNHDTKHTFYEFCLPSERGCVAMLCGGRFCSSDGAYDSVWDRVKPMTGNFIFYFQYQGFVWCICMLNFWFSSNDEICADNYYYPRFKLTDICRSVKWELYLYGDMTIKVDRDCVEVLPRGVGSSSNLATGHTPMLCLPSERGMGMSMPLAVPVSSGSIAGRPCPRLDRKHLRCHCSSRVHVLCVGRLHCLCDSNVQRWCLRRHVV